MCVTYDRLLPIGSVVTLKDGDKRVMITGRIQARKGENRIYDYSACLYPEGIMNPRRMVFLNHGDIAHLFFVGFQDEEEFVFKERVLASLGDLEVDGDGNIVPCGRRSG